MVTKSRPGPLGTSCLTCKRRHKKCDLRRPICKRCEIGRYTCEGSAQGTRGRNLFSVYTFRIRAGEGKARDLSNSWRMVRGYVYDRLFISRLVYFSISQHQKSRVEDYLRLFATRSTPDAPFTPLSMLRKIINIQAQLPYSPTDPTKTFVNSPWFVDCILEQSDKVMERWYFRPVNYQRKRSREEVVRRLQNSPITRWLSLIGMSIVEAFSTGDISQDPLHETWIGYIEGCLKREITRDLSPRQTQERRRDYIHAAVMKTMITHSSSTYQILRNMTPTFLQVAYSEPKFWPDGCNLTYIPLWNILGSESHELAFFPSLIALTQWLPGFLNKSSTTRPSTRSLSSPPEDLVLVLADINACRDKSPAARDWKEIENFLITWQSRPTEVEFTKPWMKMAWYAVQESWRFALLAYLYMAVCGASSDDPRIQLCIKQILQVVGTVKKQGSSDANMSFFVQYLMVGICARNEAHRKIARDKLCASNETKLWLLRASDFVPVLDHLWHGAAAGGRPITWSDYMRSREASLPVLIYHPS
ncbi:hypothetical protein OPQ81_000349 [Rhizoctonia solani]|nr:hypothetical protein OPQ81_000349 [Rhizoctonia solani]